MLTILNHQTFTKRLHFILILVIILVAVWLRLWRLPDTPPGLEYDEAINGLDALWMVKTGTPYLFVNSLHGREALFLYPAALFTWLLGASPLTLRLASVVAGILTIPLLYRLTIILLRDHPLRYWIALVATAALATSFWHIAMSRVGLRVVLIPLFFSLTACFFWRGWQAHSAQQVRQSFGYFFWAGASLGLSQYTYISARLFPVVFALLILIVWLINQIKSSECDGSCGTATRMKIFTLLSPLARLLSPSGRGAGGEGLAPKPPWFGLLLMGFVSLLVFAPLGLFVLQHPNDFNQRAGQVAFEIDWTPTGLKLLAQHVGRAFTLFLGGSDPRIRHHLVERPVFDWLTLTGFWIGVVVAARRWHKPAFLFLLLSVLVLWLPGPLSVDPIHSPRTSGILPAFFILVAIGIIQLVKWVVVKVSLPLHSFRPGLIGLAIIGLGIGTINTYDYFVRWANHPLVYQEYKGPSIELAQYAAELSRRSDVILPYEFYAYPPVRYVLRDRFREVLSVSQPAIRPPTGPAIYVDWLNKQPSPLLVRLTYNQAGRGLAYLFAAPNNQIDDTAAQPVLGRAANPIGSRRIFSEKSVAQMDPMEQIQPAALVWGDHIHLGGYQLTPALVAPGQAGTLTLYWEGLREADLNRNVFIQILNSQGQPVTQLEEPVVKEDINYFESRDGFVVQQHLFWLGSEVSPGLYLARVGLFEPETGQRLPISLSGSNPIGDQVILTAFYVSSDPGVDPRLPETLMPSNLGQTIKVVGYSLESPLETSPPAGLKLKLYWQAVEPISLDYTAFVQLLDEQNRVVSQLDTQPLGGLYPTSRWKPGQVIIGEFPLSLNQRLTAGSYRLVTGMYDLASGTRLLAFDSTGQPWPDNAILLTRFTQP